MKSLFLIRITSKVNGPCSGVSCETKITKCLTDSTRLRFMGQTLTAILLYWTCWGERLLNVPNFPERSLPGVAYKKVKTK